MKGLIVAICSIIIVGIAGFYYANQVHSTQIGKIINNPRNYAGKEIVISGTVTNRFSFFVIRYFGLQDSSGEITVVTDQPLPAVRGKIRVKGYSHNRGENQTDADNNTKKE